MSKLLEDLYSDAESTPQQPIDKKKLPTRAKIARDRMRQEKDFGIKTGGNKEDLTQEDQDSILKKALKGIKAAFGSDTPNPDDESLYKDAANNAEKMAKMKRYKRAKELAAKWKI